MKKLYNKKIYTHKRKGEIQIENLDYNDSIIDSIKKNYKKNPDILIISHFTSPFKKAFYYEKAVNTLLAHKNDRVLGLSKDINNNIYKFKKDKLIQINEDNNSGLKLERNQIYHESGGLYVFNYNKYVQNVKNNLDLSSNYILLDQKSSFEVNLI